MSGTDDLWGQGLNTRVRVNFGGYEEMNTILTLCLYDLGSTLHFRISRRRTLSSLKALAARSSAARVTSEESLHNLELPRSLLRDLMDAHQDPWKTLHESPLGSDEISCLKVSSFGKLYFPDLPIEMVEKVLKEDFHLMFSDMLGEYEEVIRNNIDIKDFIALLPKIKNLLCDMTNHIVISCQLCEPIGDSVTSRLSSCAR